MTPFDVGALIVGVANLAGVGLLMRWVNTLKGTVAAQRETLDTLNSLNKTVLEVIKALDPERWAKEVQIHKQLADEKAAAIVEGERKKFEEERRRDMTKLVAFAVSDTLSQFRLILRLLPFFPKHQRANLINDVPDLSDGARLRLLQAAEEFPDESVEGQLRALAQAIRQTTGGMNVGMNVLEPSPLPLRAQAGERGE